MIIYFSQSDLIWCQMYWMLWNHCEICRNQMNLRQNARADVKYQYETFKYSFKSPATTRFIQICVYLRSLFNTLYVSKKPNIGQIARDVSSSSSILIEPSFLLVQFNHTPSVISAVWKSLRLSPCCLERKRENIINQEKKGQIKKWTQWNEGYRLVM